MIYLKLWVLCALLHLTTTQVQQLDGEVGEPNTDSNEEVVQYFYVLFPKKEPRPYIPAVLVPFMAPSPHPKALAFFLPAPLADWAEEHNPFDAPQATPPFDTSIYPSVPMRELPAIPREIAHKIQAQIDASMSSGSQKQQRLQHLNRRGGQKIERESLRNVDSSTFNGEELKKPSKVTNDEDEDKVINDKDEDKVMPLEDDQQSRSGTADSPVITINPRQFDVRTLKQMEWVDADGNPVTAPEFVTAVPPTDNVAEFPGDKVDVSQTSDSLEPMRNNLKKPSNGTIRQPLPTHKIVNSENSQINPEDWNKEKTRGVQQKHIQKPDEGSNEHTNPPSEEAPRNQLEQVGPHQDQEASGPYPMESSRENWKKNNNRKDLTVNGSMESEWEPRIHEESTSFNESSKKTAEMERAIDELLGDDSSTREEGNRLDLEETETSTTKLSNTGHIRKPVKIKTAIDYNPELFPNLPRPEDYASNREPTPDYYGRRQEVNAEPEPTKKSHKLSQTSVDTTQMGVPITEMEPVEPYPSVNDLQAGFGNVAVHPMAAEADPNFIRQLNEQFNDEFPVTNEIIDIAVPLSNKRRKVHTTGLSQLPIHKLDEKGSEPDHLDLIPEEEWSFSDGRRIKKVQKTTSRRDEFRAETGEGAAVLRSRKRPDNLKSATFLWGEASPMPMNIPSEATVASIVVEPTVTTTATSSVVTAEVEATTREVTNRRIAEQTISSTPNPHDDSTEGDKEIAIPAERKGVAEMVPLLSDRTPDSSWRDINRQYRQGAEVKVEKHQGSDERRTAKPQPNQDVGSDEQATELEKEPEDQSEVRKEVSKVSNQIKEAQPSAVKPLHHRKKTHKKRNQKRKKTKKAKNNRKHKITTTPTPNEESGSGEAGRRRKPYHHRAYRHRAMAAPRLTMDKDVLLAKPKNTSDLRKAVVAEVEENTIAPMIFHSSFGLMSTKFKKFDKRISKETRKNRKKTKKTKATKKITKYGSPRKQQNQYFGSHIMDVKNSTTSSPMTSTRNEYDMLVPEMPEVEQMPTTPKMVRNPSMSMFRRAPFAAPHRLTKNNRHQNRNPHRQPGTTVPQRTQVTVAVEPSTNDVVTATSSIPYSEHPGRYEDRSEAHGDSEKDSYIKTAKELVHYGATSVPNDQVPPSETDDKGQLFESRSRISPEVVREAVKEPMGTEAQATTEAVPVEESATTRTTPPMTSTYIPSITRMAEEATTKASDAQASLPAKESFYNTQQAEAATKEQEKYHLQRTTPNEVATSAATPPADVAELKNALDMIAVEPAKEYEYDNSQGYVKIPLEQYNEMILKMQIRAAEEQRARIEHGILNGTRAETVRELERQTTQAPNTVAPPLDDHEQKQQGEAAAQRRENDHHQTSQLLEPSDENTQRSFATGNSDGEADAVSAGTVQAIIPLSETVNQEGDYLVRTKVNEYIMKGKAPANLEQLEKQAALMTEQQLQQKIAQLRQQQQLQDLAQFQALQQSQQGLQAFQQSQPGLQVLQQSQPSLASMQLPMLNPGLLTAPSPYYLNPPMYRYPFRKYLHKN